MKKPRRRFVTNRRWGVYVGQTLYDTFLMRISADEYASGKRRSGRKVAVIPVDIKPAYKRHREAKYNVKATNQG